MNCVSTPEDVEDGTVTVNGVPLSGADAIEQDMTGFLNPATSCNAFGKARPQQ